MVSKIKRAHPETGLNKPVFYLRAFAWRSANDYMRIFQEPWHLLRQIGIRALSRTLFIYFIYEVIKNYLAAGGRRMQVANPMD